ncbi:MAG: SDR family oxidoreductase [Clostridiales bacterium]|jgi:3-oxoacyl-[acyl-carrier protein] reductase|nr:SDR family oxidoreductase [Clostridiales bacterium]
MRSILITGSSRGIGFAIAKKFVALGDSVVLNCRDDVAKMQESVAFLRSEYNAENRVIGIRADASDYSACKKLFAQAEEAFGTVEILVNNAGETYFGLFSEMKPTEIKDILAANFLTAVNTSHIAIPSMVREKSGCIINITSIFGISGASCEAMYSAAKAGVNGLTKSLAKELAPSLIRVNAIACGAFETRMNTRLTPQEKNAFAESIPLGRFGNADEAASLAVFLASNDASYLTGQVIPLDGGII